MIPVQKCSHSGRTLGGIAIVLLLTSGALNAQDAPNPLGQPLLDSSGDIRDDAFIQIPLRDDDQRYADIDGDRLKAFLMEVDAISLADRDRGNVFWGRNIGTVGHEETQDWVERYFRANGLEDAVEARELDDQLQRGWPILRAGVCSTAAGRRIDARQWPRFRVGVVGHR